MASIVEVEDCRIKKPWLGGWRNCVTDLIYLNAASQTGPSVDINYKKNHCSRGVQLKNVKNASCQSGVDVATQMWRKDCYIPCDNDKYMTAKIYETFESRQTRLDHDGQARIIQRCFRSHKMLKNIKECTHAYRKIVEDCKKFEEERVDLHRKRHQMEIIRQTYPQTRSDFDKIYSLIESWRRSRLNFIKNYLFSSSGKAEHCDILEKTVEMLRDVELHRRLILSDHQEKELTKFLDHHCEPLKWIGYKKRAVTMISLRNQRAREYKKIHNDLNNNENDLKKRFNILFSIKHLFKIHNCTASNELMSLIDQEILLSSRGIKGIHLTNLKKRISLAFLYFIRRSHDCCGTEDFQDMELCEPNEKKLVCRCCKRLLPFERFSAHVRMKKLASCDGCVWLRQQSVEKVDYDPYTYLLNGIRADENRRKCFSTLLYVIQEPGIYHLVKNIWHGRSIVSEIDDIFRLRLVRFNSNNEWAPWNCILLTEEESEAHYYIEKLESVYSKILLDRIYLLHEIARSHFSELIRFEKKFRASSRYRMIQEPFDSQRQQ